MLSKWAQSTWAQGGRTASLKLPGCPTLLLSSQPHFSTHSSQDISSYQCWFFYRIHPLLPCSTHSDLVCNLFLDALSLVPSFTSNWLQIEDVAFYRTHSANNSCHQCVTTLCLLSLHHILSPSLTWKDTGLDLQPFFYIFATKLHIQQNHFTFIIIIYVLW